MEKSINIMAHSSGRCGDTVTPEQHVKPQEDTVSMGEWTDMSETAYALLPIPEGFAFSNATIECFLTSLQGLDSLTPLPWEKPILKSVLPEFIKPMPKAISQSIHERLITNGALMMPSIPLQNALLQTFMEYVFPNSPVIEWQHFLSIVAKKESHSDRINLLLFYAVLLSAVPFVGLDALHKAGYQTRQDAYAMFFRNIMLLLQPGYETDIVTFLQTLYLMASSSGTSCCRSGGLQVERAIFLAQSNGLFREDVAFPCSPQLRRRLAWAYYIMGCQSSFRSRSVSRVTKDFRLPMLSEEDFDLPPLCIEARRLFSHCVVIQCEKIQRDLACICISMARLCVCTTKVMEIQGKSSSQPTGTPRSGTPMFNISDYVSGIYMAEKTLMTWKVTLPPVCKFGARHLVSGDVSERSPSIMVQRSALHLLYCSTLSVLHQCHLFASSGTAMHYAASEITALVSELEEKGLHRFLPVVGVTAVLIAMATYASHIQRQGTTEPYRTMNDFHRCRRIMASLQDIYSDADIVNESVPRMMSNPQSMGY